MLKYRHILAGVAVGAFITLSLSTRTAVAMPNFARRLGVSCSTCHTVIPRLNEVGYRFRAAGFRMPDQIGKEEEKKFDVGDYFTGRLQARYDASRSTTGLTSTTKNALTFHEVTLYPATGPWARYWSSLFELSIAPEEPTEIENSYLRFNKGNDNRFFQTRVGIFHPFEGYGASDRPISISRPFFQTTAANSAQSTYFKPWGFDQAGVESGYDFKRTSFRATLFNGLVLREEDGVLQAFAAQGGPLSKSARSLAHNTPDFQLFFNQILNENGGGVSVYYYHGNLALPLAGTSDFFRNNYDRVAVYGSYPALKKLLLLGGFQSGRDHLAQGGTFTSRGFFAEADVPLHQYVTPGVRYDWFDPAVNKDRNSLRGITTFVNVPLQHGVQFIGEYQHRNVKRGAAPEQKDNAFQIRFIFIL